MDSSPTATREAEETAPDRDADRDSAAERERGRGLRGRLRARAAGLFSVRTFLLALVLAAAGVIAGNAVPLLGTVGGVVGVSAAGALLGLLGRRAYPEVALAGLVAAGAATLLDFLLVSLLAGPTLAVAGAGAGAAAGVLGHYLGRDLRAGLTRDL